MNGRDAYTEELLSAYLDGEVTVEERQLVEQRLKSNPQDLRKLNTLRALGDLLKTLRARRLSQQASARIFAALQERRSEARGGSSGGDSLGELLSAYIDGELTSTERQIVEQQLEADHSGRKMLDEFRALGAGLSELPKHRLDAGFAGRVVERISAGAVELAPERDPAPPQRRGRPRLSRALWTAATVAAAVLLMYVFYLGGQRGQTHVAQPEPPAILPAPPVVDLAEGTAEEAVEGAAEETQPPVPLDPQWALISAIGQNTKHKLVLVYEVSVTEEGVRQAAFSNLLRRHRIGFHQTIAVGPEEQKDLLKHRFLEDAQIIGQQQGREQIDRVHLFLVATMGSTADAIYMDLLNRPPGFASFHLNLTTQEAHQGVLNRLCEASGVEKGMGRAVQLLANVGMFSRTARGIGTFGAIRWVEPSLLEPPRTESEDQPADPNAPPPAVRPPAVPADFACELLFVVRELRSQSADPAAD